MVIKFTWYSRKPKKVYLSFPVGVYANRTRAHAIVAQNLYLFVYTHGYRYRKIRTYWSVHFSLYEYNAKAYVQFNICIVEHIIYLFPHLVKSHKVPGRYGVRHFEPDMIFEGLRGFSIKKDNKQSTWMIFLSPFYVHILNGLRFFDANGFAVS